ncbi:MAG: HlyD family efflux transporter periplasmic adaptor subunit [Planctomycetota bacterium]
MRVSIDSDRVQRSNAYRLLIGTSLTLAVWAGISRTNREVCTTGRLVSLGESDHVLLQHIDVAVSGSVQEVFAHPGTSVEEGRVLFSLNKREIDNQLEQAKLRANSLRGELASFEAEASFAEDTFVARRQVLTERLRQARLESDRELVRWQAEVDKAKIEARAAEERFSRAERLLAQNAASVEERDMAKQRFLAAKVLLRQAQVPLDNSLVSVFQCQLGVLDCENRESRRRIARILQSRTDDLELALLELDRLKMEREKYDVRSPITGVVTKMDLQRGDVVTYGKADASIAPVGSLVFQTSVPSDQMRDLHRGLEVWIEFDRYSQMKYGMVPGAVSYVGPDSLLETIADGSIVASYPVRINIAPDFDQRIELQMGMMGTARITIERRSIFEAIVDWCVE